jgi:hypothetical protein
MWLWLLLRLLLLLLLLLLFKLLLLLFLLLLFLLLLLLLRRLLLRGLLLPLLLLLVPLLIAGPPLLLDTMLLLAAPLLPPAVPAAATAPAVAAALQQQLAHLGHCQVWHKLLICLQQQAGRLEVCPAGRCQLHQLLQAVILPQVQVQHLQAAVAAEDQQENMSGGRCCHSKQQRKIKHMPSNLMHCSNEVLKGHLVVESAEPLQLHFHCRQQPLLRQERPQPHQHLCGSLQLVLAMQRHHSQGQVGCGCLHAGLGEVG